MYQYWMPCNCCNSLSQKIEETTVQNCFRKAGISGKAAEEILDENHDSFKDFTAEDDMELDETIEDVRTGLPEEAPFAVKCRYYIRN